ncbi:peptidase M4 [Saccharospirillum salsuginis]|uniref:Peptidase M4 n=1 Tax=Saccharospirillum salsuginis TaxID=418750 RepID=A0A918N5N0_9GAMM|nr:peptidase M4 [Saccharospirillum salsuginis]
MLGLPDVALASERHLRSEDVREMVAQGTILSLETLLERHADLLNGRLLDVEVEAEEEHGVKRFLYEVEVLGADGIVREFEFDAATGQMIEMDIED